MSEQALFVYGTLCHPPLLQAVLGRQANVSPAVLAGYTTYRAKDVNYPVLRPQAGAEVQGLLVEGLSKEDYSRLNTYEGLFHYSPQVVSVRSALGDVTATAYMPNTPETSSELPWSLITWAEKWGEASTVAAHDITKLLEKQSPEEIAARYPHILVRAASRVRAKEGGKTSIRRQSSPEDVAVNQWTQPYSKFFSLEEMDLQFRRFDGKMSPQVNRAVFISGDATSVLPYDPKLDRVLLIEQFRVGPYARGDTQPWLLEPVAGRVDPDETPEEAARRETMEEAGIELSELIPVASYYPTPGAKSEYFYSYIGLADLPAELMGRINGVEDEAEDIRTHVVSFDQLMDLIRSGEVSNGPLILSAFFLAQERSRLRGDA